MLNWKQENDLWVCYKNNDKVYGWIEDDNQIWYHLNDKDGRLDIGWFQTATDDNKWFYGYPVKTEKDGSTHYTGEMAIDWIELDSKWYYLLPEKREYGGNTHYKGECVVSITLVIDNKSYKFDKNGVLQEKQEESNNDSLVSDELVDFIAGWESFYGNAYEDPYYPNDQRYWTIGYGTTYISNSSAFPNGLASTCTKNEALTWLKQEINKVAITIKSALGDTTLSQNAFETLCDIGYNAGTGSLIGGNTWKSVISGDSTRITTALMSWNKANDVVSNGLTKRCKARVNMCLNGVYDSTH